MAGIAIALSGFAGLLLGLIFGWDAREFVARHTIRPEDVPDVVPADEEERF